MNKPLYKYRYLLLVFALIFPTVFTYVYFFSGSLQARMFFLAGKALQFFLPIFFICFVVKRSFKLPRLIPKDLLVGLISGMVLFVATILVFYFVVLSFVDEAFFRDAIWERLRAFGITTRFGYVGLAIFYSLMHSFFEEYYWRLFVFKEFRQIYSFWISSVISSVGFMAHHVLVLGMLLGFDSVLTYVFSVCVVIGGMFWAWMLERSDVIYGAWLSHGCIDAALYTVGYLMIFT